MRAVGIKALNSRLSEYVRLAASGETILVTNRDRVIAEIGPPRGTGDPYADNPHLAEMVRQGHLTPARSPLKGPATLRAARDVARRTAQRVGRRPGGPVTYVDSSAVLAQILTEDRRPPRALWAENLVSSRLLEYEVWVRLHARSLSRDSWRLGSATHCRDRPVGVVSSGTCPRPETFPFATSHARCLACRLGGFPPRSWRGGSTRQLRPPHGGGRSGDADSALRSRHVNRVVFLSQPEGVEGPLTEADSRWTKSRGPVLGTHVTFSTGCEPFAPGEDRHR